MKGIVGIVLYVIVCWASMVASHVTAWRGVVYPPYVLSLGWFGLIMLTLSACWLLTCPRRRYRLVAVVIGAIGAGITIDRLIYMAITRHRAISLSSPPCVVGIVALFLILAVTATVAVLTSRRANRTSPPTRLRRGRALLCSLLVLGTIVAYKLCHVPLILAEVPETSRSLFIDGIEIHHINWGAVLLLIFVAIMSFHVPNGRSLLAVQVGGAIAVGFVLDELFYYAHVNPTDGTYLDPTWPALLWLLISVWWLLSAIWSEKRRNTVVAPFAPVSEEDKAAAQAFQTTHRTLSHRLRGFGPNDSSLRGLRAAMAWDVQYLEIDTRLTRDDVIVVYHDSRLETCTNGKGLICDHPLTSLQELRYLDSTEPIHTLADFLTEFARGQCQGQLNIDIKDFGQAEQYVDLINRYELTDRVCIVSWIPEMLKTIHALAPTVPLSFSHVPISGGSIRLSAFKTLHRTMFMRGIAVVLRGLDIPFGYELDRFLVFSDTYDSPPEALLRAPHAKGYHHTHYVQGIVAGEMCEILRQSRGSVGVPVEAATGEYVKRAHELGLDVRVFSLDRERDITSHLRESDTDVIFTNRRELVVPDLLWRKCDAIR